MKAQASLACSCALQRVTADPRLVEMVYWSGIGDRLCQRGVSTLFIDHPGVGEALRLRGLNGVHDSERWAGAAVLDQGEVDFVIVPEQFVLDNHASMKLLEETWTCVVWKHNQKIGASPELNQYLEMDHVVMSYGDGRSPILEDWLLNKLGLSRSVKAVVSDWSLMPRAIVGTEYIATLQTRLGKEAARNLPVRLIEPPLNIPALVEVLQWHRYRDHDSSSIWMRQVLADVAAKI